MSQDINAQIKEALGDVNKYYCSIYYGYEVTDKETLLRYYIKHGGAKGFRERQSSSSSCQECK
jgi:hypothetical protein